MRPIGRKRAGERTPFVNLACVGMATERAHGGIDKGRTADLIVPGFDEAVRRLSLAPLQRRRLILPISIRSALLAAVSIVVDRGPDTIEVLARATIGGYRVQFDKIVSQLRAEIRIRQVVSQLLQS